jgi:asparagine synthase (glutamine-hydrolysing)
MCGIAGSWWRQGGIDADAAHRIAAQMAQSLAHRGPDGAGTWVDAGAGIALGHRRLAILELSAAGDQPMLSASGRYCVVYNGEIYNHPDLRRRLEAEGRAPAWRGSADTETLLACIEAWGIEATLDRLAGMFAFGLWDRDERALILARDRMGEKPLCYALLGDTVVFASELRALHLHPAFDGAIDRGAVALLLRYNCIPAPHSIFDGVRKLPSGNWLRIPFDATALPEPRAYWSLGRCAEAGQRDRFEGSEAEAATSLEALLDEVVRSQMISDVPLGAFLSGGIDSSAIVALMQAQSDQPVRTFTIGFRDAAFNEAEHAAAVAHHLGTDHRELYVGERDALGVIAELGRIFDEPFAGVSQIPTVLLSRLTRTAVTVAMSGDGGDELFGGYNRYLMARTWQRRDGGRPRTRAEMDRIYLRRIDKWPQARAVVLDAKPLTTVLDQPSDWPDLAGPVSRMMALDAMTYLPDNILVKVDRSAMSASLETRAPFLDCRLVEFAWRLPITMKVHRGLGKRILRKILEKRVPRALFQRPKQGFSVPLDDWLRGELRDWAEPLLSKKRLREDGVFRPGPLRLLWDQHQANQQQLGNRLWSVLMFQTWLDEQRRAPSAVKGG